MWCGQRTYYYSASQVIVNVVRSEGRSRGLHLDCCNASSRNLQVLDFQAGARQSQTNGQSGPAISLNLEARKATAFQVLSDNRNTRFRSLSRLKDHRFPGSLA